MFNPYLEAKIQEITVQCEKEEFVELLENLDQNETNFDYNTGKSPADRPVVSTLLSSGPGHPGTQPYFGTMLRPSNVAVRRSLISPIYEPVPLTPFQISTILSELRKICTFKYVHLSCNKKVSVFL